ncbi:MAG: hypothetical protein WDN50_25840 [Bradyrhizobium sp.]
MAAEGGQCQFAHLPAEPDALLNYRLEVFDIAAGARIVHHGNGGDPPQRYAGDLPGLFTAFLDQDVRSANDYFHWSCFRRLLICFLVDRFCFCRSVRAGIVRQFGDLDAGYCQTICQCGTGGVKQGLVHKLGG